MQLIIQDFKLHSSCSIFKYIINIIIIHTSFVENNKSK